MEIDDTWIRPLVQRSHGQRLVEHGDLLAAKDAYLAAVPNADDPARLAPELHHLSHLLAGCGWISQAAEVVAHAASLCEQLAATDPEWTAPYADTLGWLAELQSRCGRDEAALRTAELGVQIAGTAPDPVFMAKPSGTWAAAS